jgi:hypothetical protein
MVPQEAEQRRPAGLYCRHTDLGLRDTADLLCAQVDAIAGLQAKRRSGF